METLSEQRVSLTIIVHFSRTPMLQFWVSLSRLPILKMTSPSAASNISPTASCVVSNRWRVSRFCKMWVVPSYVKPLTRRGKTERSTKGRRGPHGVWEQIKKESSYNGFTLVKNSAETVYDLHLRTRWTVFRGAARVGMGCEQQTHALMTLNKNISSAAEELGVCL